MIETDGPAPLPGASIPDGVPDWTTQEAARWAVPHPPRWARTFWPAWVTLAAALVAAFLPATGPVCSAGNPCGADWPGVCVIGLLLGQALWSWALPELLLAASPALVGLVVSTTFPLPGGVYTGLTALMLSASATAWAAAVWRLVSRRRQRLQAVRVAGASRHRVPGAETAVARGTIRIVVALVLLAIAVGAVLLALQGIHADARRARGAVRLTGRVVATGDVDIRVRVAGATRTLDAQSPQDYTPGQQVEVLLDGDWDRLAQEPYDPTGWQLLVLGAALPALTLLASGVRARRRDVALLRHSVPVVRAVVDFDRRGDAWVRPVDDAGARSAAFRCWVDPLSKETRDSGVPRTRADAWEQKKPAEQGEAAGDSRPCEVLVYGAPRAGSPVVLVTAAPDRSMRVLRSGPLSLPRPGASPQRVHPGAGQVPTTEWVQETGARLPAGGPVRRWGPGMSARAGALFLVLGAAAMVGAQAIRIRSGAGVGSGGYLLWAPTMTWVAPVLGGWRITADCGGVWLRGVWKVQHIPWQAVTRVAYTQDGVVEISGSGGVRWRRANMGRRRQARASGGRPAHLRAAEEIAAMHAHPELRPGTGSRPRDRGMPLGPVLAAFYLLWTAAAFFF